MPSVIRERPVPQTQRAACTLAAPEYADAFRVATGSAVDRTPEQWARAVFEEAPIPVRAFVSVGWRAALGLRLARGRSSDHVFGWLIAATDPQWIRLEVDSPLVRAELVFRVDQGSLTVSTFVSYRRKIARLIWVPVSLLHGQIIPALLRRAARTEKA